MLTSRAWALEPVTGEAVPDAARSLTLLVAHGARVPQFPLRHTLWLAARREISAGRLAVDSVFQGLSAAIWLKDHCSPSRNAFVVSRLPRLVALGAS